jgi:hypothetical protein
LQHLAMPQAGGRLRIGLHAGGEFDKAQQPCGVASDVPLQILRRIDQWQRNAHGGKVLMERDSDSPTALLRLGSSG